MVTPLPDFYSDPEVINDPKSYFKALHAKSPVEKESYHNTLMITGYEAINEVLRGSPEIFSSAVAVVGPIPPLPFKPEGDDITAQLEAQRNQLPWSAHLVAFDGEKHTRYRALLLGLLNPVRVKENEEYLYGLADKLIDGFMDHGHCNIVPDFAHAATTYAISDIMGIPVPDRAVLLEAIGAPPSQLDGDAELKVGPDPLVAMYPLFESYLKERLEKPCGDLMSELAAATLPDGSPADFTELVHLACFLFGAGQDTTSRLIAMSIKILAEDPQLQTVLRNHPEKIPSFIEEVLRYDAPVKMAYRLALKNTEVAGIKVPAGTILSLCLMAGSNDPERFENPDQFNIERPRERDHLGFSKGKHACLGAPLGRLESRICLERFLARIDNIRLSEKHHGKPGARHFRYEPTYSFRSLADLYVEFDARN